MSTSTLSKLLSPCVLCPHQCGAYRQSGSKGACGGGKYASVAAATVHHGEEPPISGTRGSGTIFFNGCSLGCSFCQNHQISRPNTETMLAQEMSDQDLAKTILSMEARGVHNINFVTPTHFAPQIAHAIELARDKGFALPTIYNSSGFDTVETIQAMEGLIDIYMPDVKWLTISSGKACANNDRYHDNIEPVILEMIRQVGPLNMDDNGIAHKGVLMRHLVLPGELSNSLTFLERFGAHIQRGVGVSLMAQYNPPIQHLPPPLDRLVTPDEYYPLAYELRALNPPISFIQDLESHALFNPDFSKPESEIFCMP